MKKLILLSILFANISTYAQDTPKTEPASYELALNSGSSEKKTFSNSESSDFSFIVRTNVRDNKLWVETDYKHAYKVRFIDYYARTSKVFKDLHVNNHIDLSELNRSIFIVKFVDQKNKKVISSQVLNLKKDIYDTHNYDNEPSYHRRQKF